MRNYILFSLLFISQFALGQNVDFGRIVPDENTRPRTFEEQLVQWAWYNSPENAIYKQQIELVAKRDNLTWWEVLDARVTFNVNEFHLRQDSVDSGGNPDNINNLNNNLFFPKYNFSLSLNLGALASRPMRKKVAKTEMKILELEEQQKMMKVRAEVLQRYENYELALEILKSKTQAAEEAESVYTLVQEQFENDKVDFKDFSAASASFHGANDAKTFAQFDVNKAKIALEELIGIPWDKAVKRRKKK